ncbi:hypothetical protein [Pseudoduganella lutea]|uniref:Uncharacterized protein n=1 Tax=Pseudoduganella lutea TaxID=321985 RepID=A0A4P6L5X2_9BURK|nr:hypothetical protein [Pseudoduganella lutea]QBE66338.1 hypothetical protein EWM63_27975 [Pseudoduganella lutea]
MKINEQWLAESASSFAQLIEGADGGEVGRWMWEDMDDTWRAARGLGITHANEDALAEAEAWQNT